MARPPHRWSPTCRPPTNLVRPVRCDPTGVTGPTRGQASGKKWRQTTHGFYVPADVDGSVPEQRVLEKSTLLPIDGAVTGWGSLRLQGGNFFDGLRPDGHTEIPVMLCVGPGLHRTAHPGVRFSQDRLDPGEVIVRCEMRVAVPERAVFDEMRTAEDVREAVVAIDMATAAYLTSLRRTRTYVEARARWNGVPQARRALDLAVEGSRSPNETRMRWNWEVDAGYPRPLVNQEVWDLNGNLLGIADLLDPVAGVVGEFDGADHRGARRHSKDVDREGRFRGVGLEFFRVTGPDILHRARVVDRMAATRGRAKWQAESRRAWTITPPPGWQTGQTLDEYLDERDWRWSLYAQYEREGDPDIQELINM